MREIRQSGSEGGEPQLNAAFLPLSLTLVGCVNIGYFSRPNVMDRHFRCR